jgi:hypothetical protein
MEDEGFLSKTHKIASRDFMSDEWNRGGRDASAAHLRS